MQLKELQQQAVELLKNLIKTQSFSREEDKTADLLEKWFKEHHIPHQRYLNNVWATNKNFDETKPTLLLNSHHDTVKPNSAYSRDPFNAEIEEGKLFGLGSNDAGGCLVALLATFTYLYSEENLSHNISIRRYSGRGNQWRERNCMFASENSNNRCGYCW